MRVNEDYEDWNVTDQEQDPSSVLVFWRAALAMRKKQHDVLVCTCRPFFIPYVVA